MAVLEGQRTRLSIGFGDFLRVLLSAKMRSCLGEMDFSHASMTLLQLSTAFDMAVDGKGAPGPSGLGDGGGSRGAGKVL